LNALYYCIEKIGQWALQQLSQHISERICHTSHPLSKLLWGVKLFLDRLIMARVAGSLSKDEESSNRVARNEHECRNYFRHCGYRYTIA
jgi:hypothetical protein